MTDINLTFVESQNKLDVGTNRCVCPQQHRFSPKIIQGIINSYCV